MKPVRSTVVHEGNISTDKSVKMTFNEESTIHLMGLLTDAYSDKLLAIIREYSTNALDAHKEAGVTDPIEVIIPTRLSYEFKVRDYGAGMSLEEIYMYYAQYGASSKRDSNDFNGMLGIGCKSALSYTNQFVVNSINNGTKITALVARAEDGSGSVSILSEIETEEPSGLEVVVPIAHADIGAFQERAKNFYTLWDSHEVDVKNLSIEFFRESFEEDGDKIRIGDTYICPSHNGSHTGFGRSSYQYEFLPHIIVMGNVPYQINSKNHLDSNEDLLPFLRWFSSLGLRFIHFAPVGSFSFLASRESIVQDSRFLDYIKPVLEDIQNNFATKLQSQLDALDDPVEAISFYKDFLRYNLPLTWKGEDIDPGGSVDMRQWYTYSNTAEYTKVSGINFIATLVKSNNDPRNHYYVKNYKADGVPNKLKDFLVAKYKIDRTHRSFSTFYFMETMKLEKFARKETVIDWDDISEEYRKYSATPSTKTVANGKPKAKVGVWESYKLEGGEYVEKTLQEPFPKNIVYADPGGRSTEDIFYINKTTTEVCKLVGLDTIVRPTGGRFYTFNKKADSPIELHRYLHSQLLSKFSDDIAYAIEMTGFKAGYNQSVMMTNSRSIISNDDDMVFMRYLKKEGYDLKIDEGRLKVGSAILAYSTASGFYPIAQNIGAMANALNSTATSSNSMYANINAIVSMDPILKALMNTRYINMSDELITSIIGYLEEKIDNG